MVIINCGGPNTIKQHNTLNEHISLIQQSSSKNSIKEIEDDEALMLLLVIFLPLPLTMHAVLDGTLHSWVVTAVLSHTAIRNVKSSKIIKLPEDRSHSLHQREMNNFSMAQMVDETNVLKYQVIVSIYVWRKVLMMRSRSCSLSVNEVDCVSLCTPYTLKHLPEAQPIARPEDKRPVSKAITV